MEIVKLSKKGLRADVEAGLKRNQIAEKYNLPVTQLNKAMKLAGLTGMRAKSVSFELVDDDEAIEEIMDIPEKGDMEEFKYAPSFELLGQEMPVNTGFDEKTN